MARAYRASFTVEGLTRIDTLYFTTTVFSTVGFGDISPALSESGAPSSP